MSGNSRQRKRAADQKKLLGLGRDTKHYVAAAQTMEQRCVALSTALATQEVRISELELQLTAALQDGQTRGVALQEADRVITALEATQAATRAELAAQRKINQGLLLEECEAQPLRARLARKTAEIDELKKQLGGGISTSHVLLRDRLDLVERRYTRLLDAARLAEQQVKEAKGILNMARQRGAEVARCPFTPHPELGADFCGTCGTPAVWHEAAQKTATGRTAYAPPDDVPSDDGTSPVAAPEASDGPA